MIYVSPPLHGAKQNVTAQCNATYRESVYGKADRCRTRAWDSRLAPIKSVYSRTIVSLLWIQAQVRLESVPVGESWSLEKTGSKWYVNESEVPPPRRLPVQCLNFNYLDRWPNDWNGQFFHLSGRA